MTIDIRDTPVSEVMTRQIEMVAESTPIRFVAKLLVEKKISGLPVTDDDGVLNGVISAVDLLRAAQIKRGERGAGGSSRGFYSELAPSVLLDPPRFDSVPPSSSDAPMVTDALEGEVRDYMSALIVSVPIDATVRQAAQMMTSSRVSRVLVLDSNANLAGLLTQSDIVRLVAGQSRAQSTTPRDSGFDSPTAAG